MYLFYILKHLIEKAYARLFFLKQFSICLFLITDIPFTEYNERKKRNLNPQNFRPALHIVTNHVSGEMPVQLWGVCVCTVVCAGLCRWVAVSSHGQRSMSCTATSASCGQILKSSPWQDNARGHCHWLWAQRLQNLGLGAASHSLSIYWLLGIPLAPRRKCPIFTFHIRTQECVLPAPTFSSHPRHRAKTNWEISVWVPASTASNGNVDGCTWVCPCSVLQPCPCSQQPTGNKKTADSINTSVRCSKKKRQPPLLEWEAT